MNDTANRSNAIKNINWYKVSVWVGFFATFSLILTYVFDGSRRYEHLTQVSFLFALGACIAFLAQLIVLSSKKDFIKLLFWLSLLTCVFLVAFFATK